MAAVTIPACFLAIYGLAEVTSVSVIVQYLAALIGLGVAIDYSLLLVTRWREEQAAGHDGREAVTGILLDATVVRALLVPALVVLFGRWNWWVPPLARRLVPHGRAG
jgi:RND superfamily putative drug exporter